MSLSQEQQAFTQDVAKIVQWGAANGYALVLGEVARTAEQQSIYVQTGRSKTFNSLHLSRLAVDFVIIVDGQLCVNKEKLAPLGAYWESLSPLNSWGGNGTTLVDTPHFSRGIGKPEWKRVT